MVQNRWIGRAFDRKAIIYGSRFAIFAPCVRHGSGFARFALDGRRFALDGSRFAPCLPHGAVRTVCTAPASTTASTDYFGRRHDTTGRWWACFDATTEDWLKRAMAEMLPDYERMLEAVLTVGVK